MIGPHHFVSSYDANSITPQQAYITLRSDNLLNREDSVIVYVCLACIVTFLVTELPVQSYT